MTVMKSRILCNAAGIKRMVSPCIDGDWCLVAPPPSCEMRLTRIGIRRTRKILAARTRRGVGRRALARHVRDLVLFVQAFRATAGVGVARGTGEDPVLGTGARAGRALTIARLTAASSPDLQSSPVPPAA